MTHLFAVGTDFEKGFGTVRGHVSTALASWANWQGDSCHDCPEILDRDERGFNSRVRLQLALAWAWQTSSFCLLIFFITSIAANGPCFRDPLAEMNESDHDSSNTLALYNGLKLTRPNEGYQWLSGCFCVDPLLLTSSSRVELPRGRHWSLETWKCRGELCTLHKNFSYPCKVRLRNQRLASWKLWNYLSLSSRRRAYPKRTLRITLRSSSSALDSSFLIWRTSSRAPASRFSSRAAISRNFFSSFRASNSSTSLKDWDLGSSNKSFSGCAASFRLRPPLSLFSPLIFTSSFGPATFAALEIAEVAAVLRELVEIVLLESSRAATSFARAFGHDFATWPTSLQ